jgi:hypothetical protein
MTVESRRRARAAATVTLTVARGDARRDVRIQLVQINERA